jgi:hypothetical protein
MPIFAGVFAVKPFFSADGHHQSFDAIRIAKTVWGAFAIFVCIRFFVPVPEPIQGGV